jgi:hypothetical protein
MPTNDEVEREIAQRISEILRELAILPVGYRCEVHLQCKDRKGKDRKKRRDTAFIENWDPDTDSIRITFSPAEEKGETAIADPSKTTSAGSIEDRLADLVRALDRAEGRPGYEFVSLKWFRDTALAHEGFPWAADESARHDVLREAIDRRWILTSKVPNPRPPNFPVTAIRLNRQLPEVSAVLGSRTTSLPAFRPVPIRGEPLSATVLRDRR